MRSTILFIIFLTTIFFGNCQNSSILKIDPIYNGNTIEIGTKIKEEEGKWIEFSVLRFYLTDLTFYSGKNTWKDKNEFHLLDFEDTSTFIISEIPDSADSLTFFIGIDSVTNVSGILDGVLDPINGMYWTWNSGYINFKLEGKSSSSTAPDKSFEFHLGGYLSPFPTIQRVAVPIEKNEKGIQLQLDLEELLKNVDLTIQNGIMIPGKDAAELSSKIPTVFRIENDEK